MRSSAAAAFVALLAGAAAGGPITFPDVMTNFEARVASYLGDTPEEEGNADRARDRKVLMKALAAIDREQAKPSPLAAAKCIAKQEKALAKEIPNGEMASHLDQVALEAFEAAGGEVQALRGDLEALPATPAGDAALLLVDAIEEDLAAAALLPTRAERLTALARLVKVHAVLRKKYAKVVKGLEGVTTLTALVDGQPFTDSSVFGTLILAPGGGVVSLTFSASAPEGEGVASFVLAVSTENVGGFITPGTYAFDNELPVATAVYSESDALGLPVLTILGETGSIVIASIDASKGTLSGTFSFDGVDGSVTGGTFFLTGLMVVTAP